MPFIKIKSLRFKQEIDIPNVISSISRDFSNELDIDIKHITVTWEYIEAGHYASSGETVEFQPNDSHPLLVDILAPDFNDKISIKAMLETAAHSITRNSGIPIHNIFINIYQAHSGMVFDSGEIVGW